VHETLYVHLHDGRIVAVDDVSGVMVTDTAIVFLQGAEASVSYPRSAVYFTCCSHNQPPASS
jgi:hypothetical protein